MKRCLQLAACGQQNAKPNPMVGAVLVADDRSDVAEILSAAGDGGIVVIVRPACHADALVREIVAKAPRGRAFVLDTLRTLVIVNLRPDLPDQYLRARF